MIGFIKKILGMGETVKSTIDPPTPQIDPTEGLEYFVVRTLTFNKKMGDDLYKEDTRQLEVMVKKIQPLIKDKEVIIVHSASTRATATANELRNNLTSKQISVASCVPTQMLTVENSNYCNEGRLKTIVKDLVNGHYIIYITHEMNLQNYGLTQHKIEKFFPLAGHGVTHDGQIIK